MSKNSNNITEIDGRPMNIPKLNKELDERLNESKSGLVHLNRQNNNEEIREIDFNERKNEIRISIVVFLFSLFLFGLGIYSWSTLSDEDYKEGGPSKKELESFYCFLGSSWIFYIFLGFFNEIEIVSVIQKLFFLFCTSLSVYVWYLWSMYNNKNS